MYEDSNLESSLSTSEDGDTITWGHDSERKAFLKEEFLDKAPRFKYRDVMIYSAILTVWVLSILLTIRLSACRPTKYTYETGFETELDPLHSAIEIQQVKFTGGLYYHDNGTVYRVIDPEAVQYVGEPSDEIDKAWDSLIQGMEVDLIDDEAETVINKTYRKPGGWWSTGVDVFHQLHCINMARKGLRRYYYTQHDHEPLYTMHIDHCLDYLRQTIMCHADLTTTPFIYSPALGGRIVPDFERVHTCRDFDSIQQWALARDGTKHSFFG